MDSALKTRTVEAIGIVRPAGQIPSGPEEKYTPSIDLLDWMMENMRRFGDVFRASIYGYDTYVVSDPCLVDHVLRENWQNYKKGQSIKRIRFLLGNGLMVSEGDLWKSQRRLIQPAFHQEMIAALGALIIDCNKSVLENWRKAAQESRAVNVTRDVSMLVLEMVLRSIFGNDYDLAAPHFCLIANEPARDMEFARVFRPLGNLIPEIASKRRSRRSDSFDLLGFLVEARDRDTGKPMSDTQLVSEVLTLIVAGHETTASTLSWVWYLLSQHPEVEERLALELADLDKDLEMRDAFRLCAYTRAIIEEAMRLYPPGWLLTRRALKDDRLGPYFVPAGTEVYISPYLIQRNPALWSEPDVFNPDRFLPAQSVGRHPLAALPFSAGPRKCVGENLARLEMQLHLMIVARRVHMRCAALAPIPLEAGVNLRSRRVFMMRPELNNG